MAQTIFAALDLETTGLSAERNEIIEIGVIRFTRRGVQDTFSSFVNPRRHIPFQITQLTGIKDDDVRNAPFIPEVLPQLSDFIGDATIVGHNIRFDLDFLTAAGLHLRNRTIDTFALASVVMPHAMRYSLENLAQELGIQLSTSHRALADADTSRQLFLALCERGQALPLLVLQEINRVAQGSRWSLANLFQDFERQASRRAFSSNIGAQLIEKGLIAGTHAFGLLVGDDATEPTAACPEAVSTDTDTMAAMLMPGGLIQQRFPSYEFRDQQVVMLKAVADTLRGGQVLLVEAATGTGKSLAYLIPAVHFAVSQGRRLVVSTNTINLQDQLFEKDIPHLQRGLSFDVRSALLKGRSNYLCLRKLNNEQQMGRPEGPEMQALARIMVWAHTTATGDRSELFLPTPRDRNYWARVAADSQSCLGEGCVHFEKGCFLQHARRQAESAHVIVANHSLLVADALTENAVLPEYTYLIIDEAHHLENATTQQLSFELTQEQLIHELSMLSGELTRGRQTGLLEHLLQRVSPALKPTATADVERYSGEVITLGGRIGPALYHFLCDLAEFAIDNTENEGHYGIRLRLTDSIRKMPAWSSIEIEWENISSHIGALTRALECLKSAFMPVGRELDEATQAAAHDLDSRIEFWKTVKEEMAGFVHQTRAKRIDWLEVKPKASEAEIHSAPLHVGELIKRYLLDRHEATILTSATLRVGDSFDFVRGRLGLYDSEELALDSPFDYRASTLIYQPMDVPEPATPHYQHSVAQAVDQVARALRGRTLVLFTSYRQLQTTVEAIGPGLAARNMTVLEQGGGGSRARLLEQFREGNSAILFGTRSFWEGVDIVGPALSCVIIVRLPFSVPSEPIFAARAETFDDPFYEYSVPEAVLRFRQGFGRLIRSKADRGVVVILDRRLTTKRYGEVFLKSLPKCETELKGSIANLGERVTQWIDGHF